MRKWLDNIMCFFEKIEAFFLQSFIGGICPWCGSNDLFGRSGKQFRHCDACDVEFKKKCPVCKDVGESLAFNEKTSQYGCDRCGVILVFKNNEYDENGEYDVVTTMENKRALWLTAYGLRANLFVTWLAFFTLIIGLATLIVVLIIR